MGKTEMMHLQGGYSFPSCRYKASADQYLSVLELSRTLWVLSKTAPSPNSLLYFLSEVPR